MSEPTEFFAGTPDLPGDAPRPDLPEPRSGTAQAPVSPESGGRSGDGGSAGAPTRAPGRALTSMLLPELQRVAQSMGITGVGRMRKSQLIEAIQSRQGGSAAGPVRSATASAAVDHSATRDAPAGAGAPRRREQDAMEPDKPFNSGPGEGAQAVTSGRDTRPGSAEGTAGSAAPGQLTFAPADTSRAAAPTGEPAGGEAAGGAAATTTRGATTPSAAVTARNSGPTRAGTRAPLAAVRRTRAAAVRRTRAAAVRRTKAAAGTTTTVAAAGTATGSATATGAAASAAVTPSR